MIKKVNLKIGDLEVNLEADDEHQLEALNQFAVDDLAFLIQERIRLSKIFDADDGGDGGDKPPMPAELKPPEPLKPSERSMYA